MECLKSEQQSSLDQTSNSENVNEIKCPYTKINDDLYIFERGLYYKNYSFHKKDKIRRWACSRDSSEVKCPVKLYMKVIDGEIVGIDREEGIHTCKPVDHKKFLQKRCLNKSKRKSQSAKPECNQNHTSSKRFYFNSRCQIEIIDFSSKPDDHFRYIFIYQDFLTKFVVLRPLRTNARSEIARQLLEVFLLLGAPFVIQSEHGRDFCSSIISELKLLSPDLAVIHGEVQYSNCSKKIKLTEDIECLLKNWMEQNGSSRWTLGLHFVQFRKNKTMQPNFENRCPYNEMFKHISNYGLPQLSKDLHETVISEEEILNSFTLSSILQNNTEIEVSKKLKIDSVNNISNENSQGHSIPEELLGL